MDIIAEIGQSRRYTLHSHTQFCDGYATMAEFAEAAVKAGFSHYGFSPHSPIPVESPCNMSTESVPVYLAEIERLKNLYGDHIRLYASMEIDWLGQQWGPAHDYFQSLPLDYRIGSVHFLPDQDGNMLDIDGSADRFKANMVLHFHNDLRYVVDTFFAASIAMVEAGGFDIIGHFDKITQNACAYSPGADDTPWFKAHVSDLIDAIAASGIIVEINTKAYASSGRIFPDPRWLQRLYDAHVPMVVNSDAHRPELIDASRDTGLRMLDNLSPSGVYDLTRH